MKTKNTTSELLIAQLKSITNDTELDILGFDCLGQINKVYPNLKTDSYRIWIWENKDGYRVATIDLGNTHCSYACEGTIEELIKFEANVVSKQ